MKVEVRSSEGKLLVTVVPSEGPGHDQFAFIGRRRPGDASLRMPSSPP
jgi:hypothetical protein